jgi:hypothetical protein
MPITTALAAVVTITKALLPPAEAAMKAEITRRLGDAFGATFRNAGRFKTAWSALRNPRLVTPDEYEAAQVALQLARYQGAECVDVRARQSSSIHKPHVVVRDLGASVSIDIAIRNRGPFQIGLVEQRVDATVILELEDGIVRCDWTGEACRTGVVWIAPGNETIRYISMPHKNFTASKAPTRGAAETMVSGTIVVAGPWEQYEQRIPFSDRIWLPVEII